MKLDKQNERGRKLAGDIAELVRQYEAETQNRVEWIGIEESTVGMYDVQVKFSFKARSLDTFTHSTALNARRGGEE